MFTWLKRRTAAAVQPARRSVASPVRTPAPPATSRSQASRWQAPGFVDTEPLPEVVAEGNTQADWSMWEDSVMALDSQMQDIVPSNRVYVRDTRPSQLSELGEIDAFASVRGKRDV